MTKMVLNRSEFETLNVAKFKGKQTCPEPKKKRTLWKHVDDLLHHAWPVTTMVAKGVQHMKLK